MSWFTSELTTKCEPIFRLFRKGASKQWNEECQEAFELLKRYLTSPSVPMPPRPNEPLTLYLTVTQTTMGALLAQHQDRTKKETTI